MKKMYQSGTMDIQYLPLHILEEIFLKLSDRKVLRLVSKTFKNIVDKSPKLMEKYVLNVEKFCEDNNCEGNAFYQYLKFEEWDLKGYKFINNYQHKDWIKGIQIDFNDCDETAKCSVLIQHILLNFDNLEHLKISNNCECEYYDGPYISEKYDCLDKFIENKHSKLISLEILSYDPVYSNNVIEWFADIKSIKKFKIYDFCAEFPIVKWELDELVIVNHQRDWDGKLAKAILSKQNPCLKVLKIRNLSSLANFIVQHFPNLEKLYLDNSWSIKLENEFLIANDKLKVLKLSDASFDFEFIETILMHYRSIEMLEITESFTKDDDNGISKKITLQNLKKFIIKIDSKLSNSLDEDLDSRYKQEFMESLDKYLQNIKMPNLRFLKIYKGPDQHLDEIQIFKHVEHLDIFCIDNLENFLEFLRKFPNLKLLKMTEFYFNFNLSVMNTILQIAPSLKQLEMSKESTKKRKALFMKMKKHLNSKNVNFILY